MLLRIGGYLNIFIAIVHIVGLYWGKSFFAMTCVTGLMLQDADISSALTYFEVVLAAALFFIVGLYGLSAGGTIKKRIPFLKSGIFIIAVTFLFRGVGGYIYAFLTHVHIAEMVYASIAMIIGVLYLAGGIQKWKERSSTEKIRIFAR